MVYSRPMTLSRGASHSVLKWLYPGMHIKRWLILLLFGISLMGLGAAYILKEAYLSAPLPGDPRLMINDA